MKGLTVSKIDKNGKQSQDYWLHIERDLDTFVVNSDNVHIPLFCDSFFSPIKRGENREGYPYL